MTTTGDQVLSSGAPITRSGRHCNAWALPALLILPVLSCGSGSSADGELGTHATREIISELFFALDRFEVLQQRREEPLEIGMLVPNVDLLVRKQSRPGIYLPPPMEVALRIRPDEDGGTLRLAAAVDRGVRKLLEPGLGLDVRFEVEVDGESVFDHTTHVELSEDGELNGSWVEVGGAAGLTVSTGQEVRLRTSLPGHAAGFEQELEPAVRGIRPGFGGLVIEHMVEREAQPSSEERPSVVFIVMDTQRRDRLGLYGHEGDTSPALDALAERALVFDNAYSTASWTWPSTASMLTGLLPFRHGVQSSLSAHLDGRLETLAESFARAGYATAGFVTNPLIIPEKNYDQGFQLFKSWPTGMTDSSEVIPEAMAWMEEHKDQAFFLYLHLTDPHEPYRYRDEGEQHLTQDVPEGYPELGPMTYYQAQVKQYLSRAMLDPGRFGPIDDEILAAIVPPEHQEHMDVTYDAAVRSGDAWVEDVLAEIEALDLWDRLVLAYTSDHGEELWDHGCIKHGISLHAELVRVPLLFAGAGVEPGRVESVVSNRHVASTLAGVAQQELNQVDDPLDLLSSSGVADRPVFFMTNVAIWNAKHAQNAYGIRTGNWVLHFNPTGSPWGQPEDDSNEGEVRLFDISTDPTEMHDLAAQRPELAAELKDVLLRRLAQEDALSVASVSLGADASTRELLEAIGYTAGE